MVEASSACQVHDFFVILQGYYLDKLDNDFGRMLEVVAPIVAHDVSS